MNKLFLWICVVSIILLTAGSPEFCGDGFYEDFVSSTLDPAWQVVEFAGQRVYGYSFPANHISLTANPGHLRYYLDPMSHYDGFLNDYQTTYHWHSCCDHDPGLELHRNFNGDHWVFMSKGDYHLPYTNGRNFPIRIYFGDGGSNTYYVFFGRGRDVHTNNIDIWLQHKHGPSLADQIFLERVRLEYDLYGPADSTVYFKLMREGGILTAMWSEDGNIWTTAFIRNMGSLLEGLTQRVVVTGHCWFNTGGSYVDYDYMQLTPVLQIVEATVDIDSDTLNLKSKGKWITAYIELPTDYDLNDIDIGTVKLLYGNTHALAVKGEIQGYFYMAKFDRNQVKDMLTGVEGPVELKVTGKVGDTLFEGTDSIRVK